MVEKIEQKIQSFEKNYFKSRNIYPADQLTVRKEKHFLKKKKSSNMHNSENTTFTI